MATGAFDKPFVIGIGDDAKRAEVDDAVLVPGGHRERLVALAQDQEGVERADGVGGVLQVRRNSGASSARVIQAVSCVVCDPFAFSSGHRVSSWCKSSKGCRSSRHPNSFVAAEIASAHSA